MPPRRRLQEVRTRLSFSLCSSPGSLFSSRVMSSLGGDERLPASEQRFPDKAGAHIGPLCKAARRQGASHVCSLAALTAGPAEQVLDFSCIIVILIDDVCIICIIVALALAMGKPVLSERSSEKADCRGKWSTTRPRGHRAVKARGTTHVVVQLTRRLSAPPSMSVPSWTSGHALRSAPPA